MPFQALKSVERESRAWKGKAKLGNGLGKGNGIRIHTKKTKKNLVFNELICLALILIYQNKVPVFH